MIKIENTEVLGWEHVIRGMRNPMNSWNKSDSYLGSCNSSDDYIHVDYNIDEYTYQRFNIGPNDQELMLKLVSGGPVHAKYRRMIIVYLDITAPLYWWKEFDTYKIGTVANSCSTMHKIHDKEFDIDDFSAEHSYINPSISAKITKESGEILTFTMTSMDMLNLNISVLNSMRNLYLESNNKTDWWQMIQLLPSSYNQKRTIMLNYEVLVGIYKHRKNYKLDEWVDFCKWIEGLPFSEIIVKGDNYENN